jgi:hypothetical protein
VDPVSGRPQDLAGPRPASLEFIVIGAQKAGTTTLWNLLRDHPQLWLPDAKEAPFFSHTEVYRSGWRDYLRRLEAPTDPGVLRGTVTPHYMQGWLDTSTDRVAERIAALLPDVRLIALLRDPVERARSQHAMATARGHERRGVDRAMSDLLRPDALRRGRLTPDDTNTYVVQGEYGRILGEYLNCFPRTALHVELSESLAREPIEVVGRILSFLGAHGDYEPANPFQRAFTGGREPRVSADELLGLLRAIDAARASGGEREAAQAWVAERSLDVRGREEFERIMQRYLGASPERWYGERVSMEFTLRKIWNFVPSPPESLSDAVRAALRAHFLEDAAALRDATGLTAPWGESG